MSHARHFAITAWWKSGITCCPFHVHWYVTNRLLLWAPDDYQWALFQHVQTHNLPQRTSVLIHTYLLHTFLQGEISNTSLEAELGKILLRACEEVERSERSKKIGERGVYGLVLTIPKACCTEGSPGLVCSHSKMLVQSKGQKVSLNWNGCLGVFFF